MRVQAGLAAVLACGGLAACAMAPLPPPQATIEGIQAVRTADLPPMSVGSFSPAPGRPTEMDHSVTVRAGYVNAPGGSFAKYLGDTLAADLQAAGKLDPRSSLVVSGVVTETHLSSETSASAALGARFTLVRDGRPLFEKILRVEAHWEWNYFADVAVPDAMNNYAGLFPKLVQALLDDPDFRAAARKR